MKPEKLVRHQVDVRVYNTYYLASIYHPTFVPFGFCGTGGEGEKKEDNKICLNHFPTGEVERKRESKGRQLPTLHLKRALLKARK